MSESIRVFKFGGASVKNADAIRNVAAILRRYAGEKLVIVVSAMGKTTNALEELHKARFEKRDHRGILTEIRNFHAQICSDLFGAGSELPESTADQFVELNDKILSPCSSDFDLEYDQVVCYGELISTSIVYEFLQREQFSVGWLDARQVIKTDNRYRDARVDWNRSSVSAEQIKFQLEKKDIVIVQGFIGSTALGNATTLGREGSDFTAAIMAYLLDAKDVTIWKDVPGMLNADPKWFKDTVKLDRISFREAIELAYFGASVIHPKTIKPLQNKNIPLYIKSFIDPEASGSIIQENADNDHLVPSYIFKADQVLISLTPKDFSFVVEDNLRDIFDILSSLGIRMNIMENAAISFSFCIDRDPFKMDKLFAQLQTGYQIKYNENLTLITIRHWDEKTVGMLTSNREILLEQRSRQTVRMVVR